jgi:Mn2+-dependent serine/threonine protein kinase
MNITKHRKVFINPEYKELAQFINSLPETFCESGKVLRNIRNEIRLIKTDNYSLVVKSYKVPNVINKIIYGGLRKSKAERAYRYAELLLSKGIGSPVPIAYITEKKRGLFYKSYFVSLFSECPHNYYDLFERNFERKSDILEAVATTTAKMHENKFLHNDYTGGNILFNDSKNPIPIEIIDLNRMSFREIDIEAGCKNFGKLRATEEMLEVMGKAYAKSRGYNEMKCISLIKLYNKSWKDEK